MKQQALPVKALKTIQDCKLEIMALSRHGGARENSEGKYIPLSKKAKHIVEHMFEKHGRYDSEIWKWLSDEADWDGRVAAPQRARVVFDAPLLYATTTSRSVPPRPAALSQAERRFDPTRRSAKKTVASGAGRY